MEIKTKHNLNDKLWFLNGTGLIACNVHSFTVSVGASGIDIGYWFKVPNEVDYDLKSKDEKEVFASKEEFLDQL